MAAIAIPRLGAFNATARSRAAEAEHRIVVGAIQMWQAGNVNPNEFPTGWNDTNDQSATLASFIDGGSAGLSATHTFGTNNFTTTNPNGTSWTYPTH